MAASYDYQNPKTGQIITIYQSMASDHKYIDDDGLEWERKFSIPNAVIDGVFNIDPNDRQEFVRKTGLRKGKMNDLFQLSAELSEKRKQKDGIDVIKEKSMDNYEKSRVKGTVHPSRKKEKLKEALAKNKHFEFEP